jgi:DNA-directed RNA polymerase subunit beta
MIAVMREFFGTNQLSQFMDQSNPLSELAHKRRVSALGVGGLTRERASFEVRDVHPTQYGRICPIATPEGPNIGLVLHFASYARVDKYGFITTPFREIKHEVKLIESELLNRITLNDIVDIKGNVIVPEKTLITPSIAADIIKNIKTEMIEVRGFVTDAYTYFDAYEERDLVITEANTAVDEFGNFTETRLSARKASEATISHVRQVTHMDVSPKQLMSETTTLIPFLEHDDATRAEMGTNMMRQAVPPIRAEAPVVGTGMERLIAEGSGYVIKATDDGEVLGVDAKHITVLYANGKKQTYGLRTFERSNHDMLIHQWARVQSGEKFTK